MARTIVAILTAHVNKAEARRALLKPPSSWQAHDYFLRGADTYNSFLSTFLPEALYEARHLFEGSLAVDPGYARAYAALSNTYTTAFGQPVCRDYLDPGAIERAYELAAKAVQLNSNLPLSHAKLGIALAYRSPPEEAIAAFERAIALNPNFTDWRFAIPLAFSGQFARAIEVAEAHMRVDPYYPPLVQVISGFARYMLDQCSEALPLLRAAVLRAPDARFGRVVLAATYVRLGRLEEARARQQRSFESSPATPSIAQSGVLGASVLPNTPRNTSRTSAEQASRKADKSKMQIESGPTCAAPPSYRASSSWKGGTRLGPGALVASFEEVLSMAPDLDELAAIARRYERFATSEARGSSSIYEQLALAVASSFELLTFLQSVPSERRQPNLFLAAVRHVSGVPRDGSELKGIVRACASRIRDVILSRSTQTNEPARCAVLLPVLAGLRQPMALVEVGASAGLCLLPDRYGYDYGTHRIEPPSPGPAVAPVFQCMASPGTPLPLALPKVGWRCGLDLNPLDVSSPVAMAWLETLVWPGQEHRARGLRAAIEIARADPPEVRRGDLLADLPAIAALAPNDLQLVVYHTAVLGYVPSQSDRDAFAKTVAQTGAVWISNEVPSVFPELAKAAPPPPGPGHFLLATDGKPVAWTGPHGQSIEWFAA